MREVCKRFAKVCKDVGPGLHRSAQVSKRSAEGRKEVGPSLHRSDTGLERGRSRSASISPGLEDVCTGLQEVYQNFLLDSSGKECSFSINCITFSL